MRLNLSIVFCLLTFINCSTPADPTSAEYWVDKLDDKQTREEALKELGKMADPKTVDAVLEWFKKEGIID